VLKSFWNIYDMKDSTNGKEPTRALGIQRLDLGVKKPRESDIDWFNPYGNWVVILLAALKVLMLQTPLVIAKKQITHSR